MRLREDLSSRKKRLLTNQSKKMAKTLKMLQNGLRIKYLVHPKKYYIFWGSQQCTINGKYQDGFKTIDEAEDIGNTLEGSEYRRSIKITNQNNK